MNKKLILSFMFLVLILALSSQVLARELDISLEQNPDPVKAGENLELSFTIENIGTENLTNIVFDLDTNNPLTLKSNSEKIIDLNVGETKTIKYNVYVESDAQDGEETVTLNYEIDGNNYDEDFDVLIAPDQVYLQIDSVSINPESVAPGQTLNLNIRLRNTANSEIKNVILKLDLSNLPFAPESVTEQRIGLINDKEVIQTNFNLVALSSAQIQVYKVPLLINYEDSYGNKYTRQDLVSINVFEKPDVELSIDQNSLIIGRTSKISIKTLNKGLGKISFVGIKILPSTDYEIIGNDNGYLGNIESDDYSSIEFSIIPKKQNINLNLVLEYRDSNNQKYSETNALSVRADNVQEAQMNGLIPGFPWLLVVIILVIIALIIFFIVRRNKKKKLMHKQE
jgi:hypothetical protein